MDRGGTAGQDPGTPVVAVDLSVPLSVPPRPARDKPGQTGTGSTVAHWGATVDAVAPLPELLRLLRPSAPYPRIRHQRVPPRPAL
jgi:hypothetical protein